MEGPQRKICLSEKFRDSIAKSSAEAGYIAGVESNENTYCFSVSACTDFFIHGLEVLGIFCKVVGTKTDNELLDLCNKWIDVLQVELENALVILFKQQENDEDSAELEAKFFSTYHHTFSSVEMAEMHQSPVVLFRARGKFPLLFELSSESETLKENIELAMERMKNVAHSEITAFLLSDSNQILMNSSTINEPVSTYFRDCDSLEIIKKQRKNKKKIPIDLSIIMQSTGNAALQTTVNHSLVIHCQRRGFQCVSVSLPLDVLAVCFESTSAIELYKLLNGAIQQQLEKMIECLLVHVKNNDFICPVPYHFYPEIWDLPITIIYPFNKEDNELENHRRVLHRLLLLPENQPFLRKLNAFNFSNAGAGYLVNPHESLPPSGVQGGKTSIVHGRYSYHHYMQDFMDDKGWGCAYRSLQTIVSWFKFQGYTDKSIPSHAQIQQALVDIGDKPQSFAGSRQWIGSQEVSFCLYHLIKVQSKILCVNSGAEMASKGRELFMHFRDQGTPVMIGGGVLAHTILGVDFNKDTGDLKFLILDPHYTGGEDLSIVQNKGWCGWKDVNFWDQNAFYNLCLPQRAEEI